MPWECATCIPVPMPRIYKERPNGDVYEIQNWDMRKSQSRDAFIVRLLSESEKAKYADLKAAGKRETEIWMSLHPTWPKAGEKTPAPHNEVGISIADLTKKQLLKLVAKHIQAEVPTMERMSTEDLRVLLSRLLNTGKIKLL